MSNRRPTNRQLIALFQQAGSKAKASSPPPSPPSAPPARFPSRPRPPLSPRRALAGFASMTAGLAVAMYINYGAVTPCGALHSKARSMYLTAVGTEHPLALALASVMPTDSVVDAMLIKEFGSAGQLQCTAALIGFEINSKEIEHQMRASRK